MSLMPVAIGLAGGVGLFLIGMSMMTDGLRLAAGPALTRVLAAATRTRWHALGAGVMVTALVQSSSAVTVAAIGFVNAGLLGLAPALWVLFGANLGTTMTGWIVALVGLRFDIQLLALPLIGVGAVLRLAGERRRQGAIGGALAGFGLLFLGIAMLQSAFAGLTGQVTLPEGEGAAAVLAQLAIGLLMTVLMQSSSASIAIAITAAQGGLIGLQGAAAVVIGANIGTTVTAVLAAVGATPAARRAAAAHVIFNALTGAVALALLPWLVVELAAVGRALGLGEEVAPRLALFHTVFNLLGIVLMWPLADRLAAWLGRRFREREETEAMPRHLDHNVLPVPALAVAALEAEVARVGQWSLAMARDTLAGGPQADPAAIERRHQRLTRLDAAIMGFAERVNRDAMAAATSERLARVLRIERYHETVAERALEAAALAAGLESARAVVAAPHAGFEQATDALLRHCAAPDADAAGLDAGEAEMELAYERLKSALLGAGASGQLALDPMEQALRRISALRRAAQQGVKAARLTLRAAPLSAPDAASG